MITGVAIRHKGTIYTLPKPNRHNHVIYLIWSTTGDQVHADPDWDQGFVDEDGKYYHRKAALAHVMKCKQPLLERATCIGGRLYSEDVW